MKHRNLALMAAVSFGTGVVDAATYLGMERVFGANMTGNVIMLGISLTGSPDLRPLGPLTALGGFVLGSWIVGLLARRIAKGPGDRLAPALLLASALGLGGVAAALAFLPHSELLFHAVTFSIGVVMGAQAIAARRVGVPDVSTIVITSTLSLLFAEGFRPRTGAPALSTVRRLLAVLSMFLGAGAGALLLVAGLWAGVAVPAGILLVVAIVLSLAARRERRAMASPEANLATTTAGSRG